MEHNIHVVYWTVVASEGMRLSEKTIERVVEIQKKYKRQGHSIDFCDFLLDDEKEVFRRCDEAERYLLTITARRSCEERV